MSLSGIRVVSLAALLTVGVARAAQEPPAGATFEDLAGRAQAELDRNPAEAAALYRQALALSSRWPEGWLYMGAALYQIDRYAEASDAFRKGIELAPQSGPAHAFLGLCEAELDNLEQALANMRKGQQLGLGDNLQFEVAVRVKAARVLIRLSSFDEAFSELLPLTLKNVDSPAVVETMGLSALGVQANSISELTPERRAVVQLAGKASWAGVTRRPTEAVAAYAQLLERYPDEPGVRYARALYLMETDMAGALAELQQELRNTPKHWPSMILVSSLLIRQGTPEEAIPVIKQAMKAVPAKYRWLCHSELGRAYMTADNLEAAIPQFEIAAKMMPMNSQVRFFLSQAYRRVGRLEDAQREKVEFEKLKVLQDPLGVPALRSVYASGQR
jgi:tetratricopeptide (TPR) repeat protein